MLTKTVLDSNGVSRNYYDSKHYVVYLITDFVNNTFYVGQKSFTDSNDLSGYWGSSNVMNKKVVKQQSELFYSKEVIYETDDAWDVTNKEGYFIKYYRDSLKDRLKCLNKCYWPIFCDNLKGRKLSEHTKKKISEAKRGKKLSFEHIQNMIKSHCGKKRSEESKKRMSEAHLGIKLSEDTKRKIGKSTKERNLGIKRSEESKKRMSEAHLGIKLSEEHKQKIREAAKRKKLNVL